MSGQFYVMIFSGRSGSSYAMNVLGHHPMVKADGEILAGYRGEKKKRTDDQMARVSRYFSVAVEPGRVTGFKVKHGDLRDRDRFRESVERAGAKVILLTRDNVAKQAISLLRAIRLEEKTGKWNLRDPAASVGPMEISLPAFESAMKRYEQTSAQVVAYGATFDCPRMSLKYEELLYRPRDTFERLFAFLGVEPIEPRADLIKHTSDDLRLVVTNLEDLREHYRGTPYEAMLSMGERTPA